MAPTTRAAGLLAAAILFLSCRGARAPVPDERRAREARPGREAAGDGAAPAAAAPAQQVPEAAGPPWPQPDRSGQPWSQTAVAPIGIGERVAGREEGGVHVRVGTENGAVHVWTPPGYAARSAGLVIYLHGYFVNADQAWIDHRLARQFRASGRNAAFVVPESPAWNGEDVWWPELGALLDAVARTGRVALPAGHVVVAGHSGAFRTILPWLADPRIDEVVLLDGLYRGEAELAGWLAGAAPARPRRLLLVGQETAERTEAWLPSMPAAVRRDRVPARPPGARDPSRTASVVYFRSQVDHMRIVTAGKVLPLVLGLTRLRGT